MKQTNLAAFFNNSKKRPREENPASNNISDAPVEAEDARDLKRQKIAEDENAAKEVIDLEENTEMQDTQTSSTVEVSVTAVEPPAPVDADGDATMLDVQGNEIAVQQKDATSSSCSNITTASSTPSVTNKTISKLQSQITDSESSLSTHFQSILTALKGYKETEIELREHEQTKKEIEVILKKYAGGESSSKKKSKKKKTAEPSIAAPEQTSTVAGDASNPPAPTPKKKTPRKKSATSSATPTETSLTAAVLEELDFIKLLCKLVQNQSKDADALSDEIMSILNCKKFSDDFKDKLKTKIAFWADRKSYGITEATLTTAKSLKLAKDEEFDATNAVDFFIQRWEVKKIIYLPKDVKQKLQLQREERKVLHKEVSTHEKKIQTEAKRLEKLQEKLNDHIQKEEEKLKQRAEKKATKSANGKNANAKSAGVQGKVSGTNATAASTSEENTTEPPTAPVQKNSLTKMWGVVLAPKRRAEKHDSRFLPYELKTDEIWNKKEPVLSALSDDAFREAIHAADAPVSIRDTLNALKTQRDNSADRRRIRCPKQRIIYFYEEVYEEVHDENAEILDEIAGLSHDAPQPLGQLQMQEDESDSEDDEFDPDAVPQEITENDMRDDGGEFASVQQRYDENGDPVDEGDPNDLVEIFKRTQIIIIPQKDIVSVRCRNSLKRLTNLVSDYDDEDAAVTFEKYDGDEADEEDEKDVETLSPEEMTGFIVDNDYFSDDEDVDQDKTDATPESVQVLIQGAVYEEEVLEDESNQFGMFLAACAIIPVQETPLELNIQVHETKKRAAGASIKKGSAVIVHKIAGAADDVTWSQFLSQAELVSLIEYIGESGKEEAQPILVEGFLKLHANLSKNKVTKQLKEITKRIKKEGDKKVKYYVNESVLTWHKENCGGSAVASAVEDKMVDEAPLVVPSITQPNPNPVLCDA